MSRSMYPRRDRAPRAAPRITRRKGPDRRAVGPAGAPIALRILLAGCACLPGLGAASERVDEVPADAPAYESTASRAEERSPWNRLFSGERIELNLEETVLAALENNPSFRFQRLAPEIRDTIRAQEEARFDPSISASVSTGESQRQRLARAGTGREFQDSESADASIGVDKLLPTGSTVGLDLTIDKTDSNLYRDPFSSARIGLSATQSLLRGSRKAANLAILRAAELDVEISRFEFKGFAEAFVAQVERTFWDIALAYDRIRIVRASLQLAEDQRAETEERIALGALAPTEGPAIQAQVAARREDLINAESNLEIVRLRLIRLIKPNGVDLWQTPVVIDELPAGPPSGALDTQLQVKIALELRPDLNQARLDLKKNEFEIIRTRNGLLPRLDFFANLGAYGFANSFTGGLGAIETDNFDVNVGLLFERPWGNRSARAAHRRSRLSRTQSEEALRNLTRLIEEEVQAALVEVRRTREQIAATRVTRRYAEEVLRSESEKFKIGRSTAILVSQAQRDLLASQIAETEASTNHWKAHIDLDLSRGSLLETRGIQIPLP